MAHDIAHDDLILAEDALEGDPAAAARIVEMLRAPELTAFLKTRGASETEARDLIGDLAGDCFGGERTKGGLHRLLGRYNGGCPLPAFFRHIALNRLISLKRKQSGRREDSLSADGGHDVFDTIADAGSSTAAAAGDGELIDLLRDALKAVLARVDPEKLVIVRLIESYEVPQKRVGGIWGWHESKISRAKSELLAEMRQAITEEVKKTDPWLHLEWEDFLALCRESSDLFGSGAEVA